MSDANDSTPKVLLVTGASSGFGEATARMVGADGWMSYLPMPALVASPAAFQGPL